MSGVAAGLGWRGRLLSLKLSARLPQVPWDLLLREVCLRREYSWDAPPLRSIGRDAGTGWHEIEVGGHRYRFPPEAAPEVLVGLYKATYYPGHPHYFEHGPCRYGAGDVVIDGGAFEGFFTRQALDRGARVVAVEPCPPMAEALRRNFAREIGEGRLTVAPVALCGRSGPVRLVVDADCPTGAAVRTDSGGPAGVEVEGRTLEDLCAETCVDRCDFVKLDIEDAEVDVLRSAGSLLARRRPRLSVAVYHSPGNYREIRRDLLALRCGYRVAGKGLVHGLDGRWRPLMLHAWPR